MKKKQKFRRRMIRGVIQLLFFVLAPGAFSGAFAGMKYLFTQLGKPELISPTAFFIMLTGLCLYTILFGRFFCGFACAFGSLGDLVFSGSSWLQKRFRKKLPRLPEAWVMKAMYLKYVGLAVILICCFTGVYGQAAGTSPWDVFSMLTSLNFNLEGYQIGIVFLVLIIIGMGFEERFFCKFLCPMGAIFSLLPILPFSLLRRERKQCIPRCSACQKQCPVKLEIDTDNRRSGECIQCLKCMDICPKNNIRLGLPKFQGNEAVVVIGKAVLLLGLFWIIGITRF